jgi:hypothetical protein
MHGGGVKGRATFRARPRARSPPSRSAAAPPPPATSAPERAPGNRAQIPAQPKHGRFQAGAEAPPHSSVKHRRIEHEAKRVRPKTCRSASCEARDASSAASNCSASAAACARAAAAASASAPGAVKPWNRLPPCTAFHTPCPAPAPQRGGRASPRRARAGPAHCDTHQRPQRRRAVCCLSQFLYLVQVRGLGEARDPRRTPLTARLHERRAVRASDDLRAAPAA